MLSYYSVYETVIILYAVMVVKLVGVMVVSGPVVFSSPVSSLICRNVIDPANVIVYINIEEDDSLIAVYIIGIYSECYLP